MHFTLNQLYQGDCLHLMPNWADASIDLIITDPPYLVNYRDRSGRTITGDDRSDRLEPAFAHLFRLLRPDSLATFTPH